MAKDKIAQNDMLGLKKDKIEVEIESINTKIDQEKQNLSKYINDRLP